MTWRATSWAKKVRTGSPAKKAILMVLAERCDDWGWSWPGQALLCEESEVGERQARNLLGELAAAGLITIYQARNRSGRKTNLYRLAFDAKPQDELPPDHMSRSERYKLFKGRDPEENIAGGPPAAEDDSTGKTEPSHRNPVADKPQGTSREPGAPGRARDPGGAARPGAEEDKTPTTPINALWREKTPELEQAIGQAVFRAWFGDAIPAEIDDDVYTVWMWSQTSLDWVKSHVDLRAMERVLGRQLLLVYDRRAEIARWQRKQSEGKK